MQKGFTLIELMIGIAIVTIITSFGWRFLTVSNGVRCVGGYEFAVDFHGRNTQILDSQGHGIPCK